MPRRLSFAEVKSSVEKENYCLLSSEYINAKTYLEFKCPKSHVWKATWNTFNKGHRCKECANDKLSLRYKGSGVAKQLKIPFEDICHYIQSVGYKVISSKEEYITYKSQFKLECNKQHKYKALWYNFKKGRRCPFCARENQYVDYSKGRARRALKSYLVRNNLYEQFNKSDITRIAKKIEAVYASCKTGEHVDHIFPLSWIDHSRIEAIEWCWSPDNLRVIDAIENSRLRDSNAIPRFLELMEQDPSNIKIIKFVKKERHEKLLSVYGLL